MQVNLIVVAYKCVHQNKLALLQVVTKIVGQVDTVQQLQTDHHFVDNMLYALLCVAFCIF